MNKLMLGVATGLASLALSAETIVWTDVAAGETAEYGKDLEGANTLKIPAGTHNSVAAAQLYYANVDGAALTVDGAGATMNLPARTDGFAYADAPWALVGADGNVVSLSRLQDTAKALTPSGPSDAVLTSANPAVRLSRDGGASVAHFDGGDWNFDAAGAGNTFFVGEGYGDNQTGSQVYFHGGTQVFPSLRFLGNGTGLSRLQFDGGAQATIHKTSGWLPDNRRDFIHLPEFVTTNEFNIVGAGTKVRCDGSFYLAANNNAGSAGFFDKRTLKMVVADGATLQFGEGDTGTAKIGPAQYGACKTEIVITNGAQVLANAGQIGNYNQNSNSRIRMDGAAWKMNCNPNYSRMAFGGWSTVDFYATNSTFVGLFTFSGKNTTAVFDNCQVVNYSVTYGGGNKTCPTPNVRAIYRNCQCELKNDAYDQLYIGSGSAGYSDATLVVDGGTLPVANLVVGNGGYGKLVITNGAAVSSCYGYSQWCGQTAAGTTGVIEMASGSLTLSKYPYVFGKIADSYVEVDVNGGTLDATGLTTANAGQGLAQAGLYLGSAGECAFNQAGGLVTAKQIILAQKPTAVANLNLKGGEFSFTGLLVGEGRATVQGDGGAIVPTAAGVALPAGLAAVTVGDTGLTIDSSYDIELAHDVTKASDAETGVLALTGTGRKTVSAALQNGETRLTEGVLALAEGGDLSATKLIVTGGAKVDLADGAQTTLALAGLVLGDDDTRGILEVDVTDSIIVSSLPSFVNPAISISGEYENGTYSIFKFTGDVDPSEAARWAATYLSGGRVPGKMYSFTTSVSGGVTSFNIVVEDAAAVDGEVEWKASGAQGDWSVAANWTPSAPSATKVALFARPAAAPVAVVNGAETVGAVDFNVENSVTVEGEGALAIADTGTGFVRARQGEHALDVTVNLPGETTFAVSNEAALAVGGRLVSGALKKTGEGRLTLSNDGNALATGVTVDSGVLAATSAAALGATASGIANEMTLGNASVVVEGEGGATHALTVDAGANKLAVIRNEADLEMAMKGVTSGRFAKRGAGKLTLALPGGQVTTLAAEHTANDNYQGYYTAYFTADDKPIAVNQALGGFNVIEGAVELKATGIGAEYTLANKHLYIGVCTTNCLTAPRLVVDGATSVKAGRGNILMGCGSHPAYNKATTTFDPEVLVTNGGRLDANTLRVCPWVEKFKTNPRITVEQNSVFEVNEAGFCESTNATLELNVRTGGVLGVPVQCKFGSGSPVGGTVRAVVDGGSVLQGAGTAGNAMYINWYGGPDNTFDFELKNGALIQCGGFLRQNGNTGAMRVVFDGCTWEMQSANPDIVMKGGDAASYELRAGGLDVVKNQYGSGKDFRVRTRFCGAGGMSFSSTGTLRFSRRQQLDSAGNPVDSADPVTLGFTGPLVMKQGTLIVDPLAASPQSTIILESGTALDLNGETVALGAVGGTGTVRNGRIDGKLTLKPGEGLVTIAADCALPARLAVDFGRMAADPLDLKGSYPVAKFAGLSSGTYNVRVSGTGLDGKYRGTLTVGPDGTATVSDIGASGFVILVR